MDTVYRLPSGLRCTEQQGKKLPHAQRAKRGAIAGASLNAEQEEEYLRRLCSSDPALADARRLTQEFAGMVRDLEGEKLDGRLVEAEASEAQVIKKFATGLRKNLSAHSGE